MSGVYHGTQVYNKLVHIKHGILCQWLLLITSANTNCHMQ